MKKKGVYLDKETEKIWLVEKIEHYHKGYNTKPFSLIIKGSFDGKFELNRCLITEKQFKRFLYLGPL